MVLDMAFIMTYTGIITGEILSSTIIITCLPTSMAIIHITDLDLDFHYSSGITITLTTGMHPTITTTIFTDIITTIRTIQEEEAHSAHTPLEMPEEHQIIVAEIEILHTLKELEPLGTVDLKITEEPRGPLEEIMTLASITEHLEEHNLRT